MLRNITKFFLYASVLCVTVVAVNNVFPFIGGKDYFFRICVEAALIFALLYWGFEAHAGTVEAKLKKLSRQKIFLAVSVFMAVYMLAVVFADNPAGAFWSNFERGDAGFQVLHYYIFFVLLGVFFEHKEDWYRLFMVSLVAGLGMVLYGAFAAGDLAPLIGPYTGPTTPTDILGRLFSNVRFQGSLGNPAYVAPYLMFGLFYILYLWQASRWPKRWWLASVVGGVAAATVLYVAISQFVGNKFSSDLRWIGALFLASVLGAWVFGRFITKNEKSWGRWFELVSWGSLALIFLVFLVLSQTRGAFIGLGVAVLVGVGYLMRTMPKWRTGLGIALLCGVVLFAALYVFKDTSVVRSIPGNRFLDSSFTDQTAQTRFWTWGSAWRGFLSRPLLGWGPENFSTVFDRYFDPRHYIPGQETETWFDRAHSIIFDYLSETGLLGFISYAAIFVTLFMVFYRRGHVAGLGSFEKVLLLTMPIGYLVQGLFIFDVLPIYINVFVFLGFANYILENA